MSFHGFIRTHFENNGSFVGALAKKEALIIPNIDDANDCDNTISID